MVRPAFRRTWKTTVAAVVGVAGVVFAASTPPGSGAVRATLRNGLRVIVVPDRLAPVATTVVAYRVGSNEAPEGFPGTAHALEHMMFRGSPGLSGPELAAISAAMGGRFNADTQQTMTEYYFTVPTSDLGLAFHVEALRMKALTATDELWARERGAIEQEVSQDLSNPEYVLYTKVLERLFAGTPYARDALGTRASFERTTAAMLRRFHERWYAPNDAVLVVVGDVRPERVVDEARRAFGEIARQTLPARPAVDLRPVRAGRIDSKTDESHGTLIVSFRMPGFDSPDYAATEVLCDVLGNPRGDLYALVPQGRALAADFSLQGLPAASIGAAEVAFPKGADVSALLGGVRRILEGAARSGVSADLVEAAKRHEVAAAEFQKNSVSGLAASWARAVVLKGLESPEDEVRAIQRVSVQDVDRVARKYLDLDRAVVGVLTPEASGAPVAREGYGGRESPLSEKVAPVRLPDWARAALDRLSVPPSSLHLEETTFPNGLRLIVQPESVSDGVSVYGHVENEPYLEVPPGKEGVDDLLGRLFDFGTTSLDRLAFHRALDEIGADESGGTDFSLRVLADRFEAGVALLADNELHPALPAKAIPPLRKALAASVAGRLQSPGYLASRAMRAALFPPKDPTLRHPTPATVSSLTSDDVQSYYRRVVRPDLTTIVVIGRITPDRAKSVVEKYFGAWNASGPAPPTTLPAVPLSGPSTARVPDASRVQDEAVLAETLGLDRSNPDYYALELGNHVLGGAFYATRLYRDLRERSGLVYHVSSTLEVGKTRGLYRVDYACDPANVAKVESMVERELGTMRTTAVDAPELRQAKALLLREIPLGESSFAEIAHGILERLAKDLPLDEPHRAAERYADLDADAVKAAFAKWMRPAALARVTQGP